MKILITGASGFVGGFLVEEALSRGLDVYAGIRATSDRSYLTDQRINFIDLAFDDKRELGRQLQELKFDYIIHNAGLTKTGKKQAYFDVNTGLVKILSTALIENNVIPKKFVFVSSLAAYGPGDLQPDGIVSNKSIPHPVTTYGQSKLAGEKHLQTLDRFPYIIVRPTAVYGPRERDLLTVFQTINKGLDLYVGRKTQHLTFIYVKDLARFLLDSALSERSRKDYFIHDGHIYTAEKFNGLIKKELNRKAIKLKIPIAFLRVIAFITEKISLIIGKYPALNIEKVYELECRRWICDISALKSDFSFEADYNLESGLKETIDWYKKNNWL